MGALEGADRGRKGPGEDSSVAGVGLAVAEAVTAAAMEAGREADGVSVLLLGLGDAGKSAKAGEAGEGREGSPERE